MRFFRNWAGVSTTSLLRCDTDSLTKRSELLSWLVVVVIVSVAEDATGCATASPDGFGLSVFQLLVLLRQVSYLDASSFVGFLIFLFPHLSFTFPLWFLTFVEPSNANLSRVIARAFE